MSALQGYLNQHFFGVLSVMRFLPRRIDYYRRLTTAPVRSELEPHLRTLRRDGIVIIPDLLPEKTVKEMRDAVPELNRFEESPEGDRAYFLPEAHRIADFSPFFEHPDVRDLVRGYISVEAVPHRRTIGLKVVYGDFPSFERNYHMDTWRQRVKAFLYLDEVGPEQAPMTYLRGSHRGLWRLWTEARIARDYVVDERGFGTDQDRWFLGSFWPHEVAQLKQDRGYEEVVCTGGAGTLVLFDGRGLHRATPLISGSRLLLNSYWIHAREHT
ncbi:phytanoyl-CoA dioxygenase family protein [Nonomuraea cavernae]|uniref:Uncharacterized protein n=1 Tax=Nonomuraea cavernae TaxID=2045107 RepID=A0A917YPS2_9ACTN|nr:phytanoyl-CoA dioxygenase family protein [Nonomuraea cavernae]MCA2183670.1 phytanoyl-CoA dioxygenase family protein [Nonomuraea cavernae]GGO61006.1 hypothetical protein GCM10012289_02210 [Nonomuraea cavernae]